MADDPCCSKRMTQQDVDEWRRTNVGRLMNVAIARFEARVFQLLAEQGHTEVPLSHLHLTRNLDRTGTRITQLAQRAAMTKQAMSEIVLQCEKMGLVRRIPDPTDARAKMVLFTEPGLAWLNAFKLALQRAETEMCMELGAESMRRFKTILAAYETGLESSLT